MGNNVQGGGLVLEANGKWMLTDIAGYSGTYLLDRVTGETSLADGVFWFMAAAEDGIYGSDQRRGHRLCRFDLALEVVEPISDHPCYGLTLEGEWLYYIHEQDRMVYRRRLGSSGESLVADEAATAFVLHTGQLYYATSQGICRCNADGGSREFVHDAVAAGLLLAGDKLIFADKKNGYRLSVLDLPTGELREHEDIVPGSMSSDGYYLYCSNRRHGDTLYRIDLELGSKIRIYGEAVDHLHVIGNEVLFSSRYEWYNMSLSGGQATPVITERRGRFHE